MAVSMEAYSINLPTELEQLIFEFAAQCWPRMIPKFMLVAWRIKIWLEPLLYKTIIVAQTPSSHGEKLSSEGGSLPGPITHSSLYAVMIKRRDLLQKSARNLYLSHDDPDIELDILSACPNVNNLWLAAGTGVTNITLSLKRLHCTLKALFGFDPPNFTLPLFSSITHLEIFNVPLDGIDVVAWSALTRLPHLTHLAFNDDDYLSMCQTIVPNWNSLRALALIIYTEDAFKSLSDDNPIFNDLAQDPRFVAVICPEYLSDWVRGAQTGRDYWSRAEDFIAKRRLCEVDLLDCCLPEYEDDEDD
ncbi:hypothetical protein R3P38DRAFT_1630807 [Favolaschia claudopus]|uniref:Uncharacterized protein n=1 Tax=Favolaschia claudopus TaxID=2862362 RepID=A0AAW0DKA3_9AGAR